MQPAVRLWSYPENEIHFPNKRNGCFNSFAHTLYHFIGARAFDAVRRLQVRQRGRLFRRQSSGQKDDWNHGKLRFSADGWRIVTCRDDQKIKIGQCASPEEVAAWEQEEKAAIENLERLRQERERAKKQATSLQVNESP